MQPTNKVNFMFVILCVPKSQNNVFNMTAPYKVNFTYAILERHQNIDIFHAHDHKTIILKNFITEV